jgi:hypothetical protein
MKFYEFNEIKTAHSSGRDNAAMNFMTRLANSFFMGSLVFYNKYSEILYEGDIVKVFGIIQYNKYTDSWELSRPLALFKSGVGEYINDLWWENLSSGTGIFFRSILFLAFSWGTFRCAKYIISLIRNGLRRAVRRVFAR